MSERIPEDVLARVEAALYAAGRPLDAEELAKVAGTTSVRKAVAMAREVARSVGKSLRSVEVVEYPGPKFAMQLKPKYTLVARKFATRPLLSRGAVKTLSYIAFFQPIPSGELALRRSSGVYQHIRELEDVGFIVAEKQGRGKAYRTTGRFAEYFGLSAETTAMKKQLESRNLSLRQNA